VQMFKGIRDKFIELSEYQKNKADILKMQVLLASELEIPKRKRYQARIEILEETNLAMSIHPLIEAGELSTVSENLTEGDQAFRDGRLGEYIEAAVGGLAKRTPEVLSTIARNALITKETALYQGLNRAVQYGDFLAKAVLYDHLVKNKKQDPARVLVKISEEFVNYNRGAGRGRDALESYGLLWFFNYSLRIQKILLSTLRERPVTGFMILNQVGPWLDVDTVASGSILNDIVNDGFDYKTGLGMGWDSFKMHPLHGLLS
jgi:hypothetical protein